MNRLAAYSLALAALASPATAATRVIIAPAPVRGDIAGAAAVAASYGAITSIFRTAEHNRAVGGVANSYHLQGRAIDVVRRPGVTHGQIAAALQRAGFRMVESLDEGDHSHFAFAGPTAASSAAVISAAPPPVPEVQKYPAILADDHGTLMIDNPAKGTAAQP